jgi:hypothetical protein
MLHYVNVCGRCFSEGLVLNKSYLAASYSSGLVWSQTNRVCVEPGMTPMWSVSGGRQRRIAVPAPTYKAKA